MPLEPTDTTSAARWSLQALTVASILLALLVGGIAAVRLCCDFVQLVTHVEVVLPG